MIFANLNAYYILLNHIWFKFIDALEISMIRSGVNKKNLFRAYTVMSMGGNTPEYFAESCSLSTANNPKDTKYTIHKLYKRSPANGFLFPALAITLNMINVEPSEATPYGHPQITYYIIRDENTCKVEINMDCLNYGELNDTDREIFEWHVAQFDSILKHIQADIESGEDAGMEYLMSQYDDGGSPND